ncbi:FPP/GGPP synthase family protein [Streptomyces griseoluteus]|uniref:FPP/GGPP synthase family protein n=1 Tax=Streptomyces griseoluteus TaxID=29306 RepID=UPI0038284875
MSDQSSMLGGPTPRGGLCNPRSVGLTDSTVQWAQNLGLPVAELRRLPEAARAVRPGIHAGWLFPMADLDLLKIISDYSLWLAMLGVEPRAAPRPAERGEIAADVPAWPPDAQGPADPPPTAYLTAYDDIHVRTRGRVPASDFPAWRIRLFAAVHGFPATPDSGPDDRIERGHDGRPLPELDAVSLFPFVEVAADCYIPSGVAHDADLRRFHQLAARTCAAIDGEFEPGRRSSDLHLLHRAGADLIDRCAAEWPSVSRYVEGLENLVHGRACWHRDKAGHPGVVSPFPSAAADTDARPQDAEFARALHGASPSGARALTAFLSIYGVVEKLLADDVAEFATPAQCERVLRMLSYTVHGGKLSRAVLVTESTRLLADPDDPDLAAILSRGRLLGWCIEILEAYLQVIDDVLDRSRTRRGKPCWYLREDVGSINAICDGMILRSLVFRLLRRVLGDSREYMELVELFQLATYVTELGQAEDTDGLRTRDPARADMAYFFGVARNKGAYYTFRLPVEAALIVTGWSRRNEVDVVTMRRLFLVLSEYYQAQNDMLDYRDDLRTAGKEGTDIQEGKSTWLLATARRDASAPQWRTVAENYGRDSEEAVGAVKAVYRDLGMENRFSEYRRQVEAEVGELTQKISTGAPPVAEICRLAWTMSIRVGSIVT